ncbi:copper resistance protein CopC [Mesobacillus maritimus]|uniref:copper resistance CopC family protein n=1 Tax=Mesobacillus maritimus TaxID=1643336 RepID=UPI00203BFCBE|nr:copper resistance CopC family protein [Mesobacillus maritimus]MCM3588291.1 copper resistance protein CopC [Mesobacillus maritimus]
MLKRIFTATVAFLLAMTISTSASAHSHLSGTHPTDGEVVTEPLNEIILEFDGDIEQGSFIDVTTSEGQAVDVQDLIIGEGTLTGTLAETLPNDDYQVNWSIISADGHPLEGEFSFTVDRATPESVEETADPSETTEPAEHSIEDQEEAAAADETEEESSSMSILFIVLLVIVVAGGVFFLTKRKK